MNHNPLEAFFCLLRIGLQLEKIGASMPCFILLEQDDWEEIYSIGIKQGVAAIQFDGLQSLIDARFDLLLPERRLKLKWFSHASQVGKICKNQYRIASELAQTFSERGIQVVVLKGIAAGVNYPQPNNRPCGDFDCFLMGRFADGNRIAQEVGAKVKTSIYVHSVITYKGLTIENHRTCISIRGSKRAKSFERLLQRLLKEEGTKRIGDSAIESPSPMFNALYLSYHAQKHFLMEGGIALRHLCDWAMLVHQQGNEIDWADFKKISAEYGFDKFVESMTRVAHQMLHVEIPETYHLAPNDVADEYLLQQILSGIDRSSYGSVWKQRLGIIKTIFGNRKRYNLFSDISYLRSIWQLIYGFCFDRHPHI